MKRSGLAARDQTNATVTSPCSSSNRSHVSKLMHDRPQHQGLQRVLNAERMPVGGEHPALLGRLADHEAASARIVGRVGLALKAGFELVQRDGVLFVQRRSAGEVRRRIKRST